MSYVLTCKNCDEFFLKYGVPKVHLSSIKCMFKSEFNFDFEVFWFPLHCAY